MLGVLYLNPHGLQRGPGGCEVFLMACPVIGEHSPCDLVISVPLDGPAAIQKVLPRVIAAQRQEVPSLGHLFNADVPRSHWNQTNIHVAWENIEMLFLYYMHLTFLHLKSCSSKGYMWNMSLTALHTGLIFCSDELALFFLLSYPIPRSPQRSSSRSHRSSRCPGTCRSDPPQRWSRFQNHSRYSANRDTQCILK